MGKKRKSPKRHTRKIKRRSKAAKKRKGTSHKYVKVKPRKNGRRR